MMYLLCARLRQICAAKYSGSCTLADVRLNMGILFRISYLLAVFCIILVPIRIPEIDLTIHDVFLFCAVGIWLIEYVVYRGSRGWTFPLHPLWIAGLMILIGGLLSSPGAVLPISSLVVTMKTFFVLTLWVSVTMVMVCRNGFWQTVWVFSFAVMVVSGIAVFDRIVGTDIGGAISGRATPWYDRSDGTLTHPNELAYLTSVGLPILFGLLLHELQTQRRRILLVILAFTVVLVAVTIYLTGSMAGLLGTLVAMGLLLLLAFLKSNFQVRLGLGLLSLLLGLGLAVYISAPERLNRVEKFSGENISRVLNITGPSRLSIVFESVDAMSSNPIIGFGMDQSATGGLLDKERVTRLGIHNVIFASWVSGGLPALVGMLFGYGVALLIAVHAMRRGVQYGDWIVVAIGAATFAWLLFDQTQPSLHHRTSWFTTALLFGLGYTIRFVLPRARFAAEANLNADSARDNYLQAEP